MLDHLAKGLGIKWSWLASDGTGLDETGYAISHDFGGLQGTTAGFLLSLGHTVPLPVAGDEKLTLAFCVPTGLGQEDGLVACPMGFKPLAWAQDLRELDAEELLAEASGFFIWWNKGLGPAVWAQLLRAQLWQNAEWRPAVSDSDHLVQRQIAHSRARIAALGGVCSEDLVAALAEYDQMQMAEGPPQPGGIGYRKGLIYSQIFKSWAIRWPGYAYYIDNGSNAAREHPGFWLSAMALTLDFKVDQPDYFEWPPTCEGPVREVRSGVFARKTGRLRTDIDGATQQAFVVSQRENLLEMLVLTLSSHMDWPYDKFDAWIGTVSCPDLPASPPATKH
jgi:hypothetical protein